MRYQFIDDGYPEAADFDDNYVRAPAAAHPARRAAVPLLVPVPMPRRAGFSLLALLGRGARRGPAAERARTAAS